MSVLRTLVIALSLLLAPTVLAVTPDEKLDDGKLEERARELSKDLRCLVCQNQSIDDSDAPLAKDLRILVRERLSAGDTDQEVMSFVVDRYGEYVLLRPRFAGHTLILWLAAPLLFAATSLGIFMTLMFRRRQRAHAIEGLSAEEEARVAALIDDHDRQ